jgi:hypothetical protein
MNASGYVTHVVQVGDSLQKIANVYNISDWKDLVYINNLEYPYICDTLDANISVGGRVLRVGDKMLIPASEYSSHANNIRLENVEKQAYGCDLDLYNFDLEEYQVKNLESKGELSAHNGELKLAEGVGNLRQRLLIRLSVTKGSMILHPEFGSDIDKYIGLKGTQQNLIKLKLAIQECILSDELINKIQDLNISVANGIVSIDCGIIPVPPYTPFKFAGSVRVLQ